MCLLSPGSGERERGLIFATGFWLKQQFSSWLFWQHASIVYNFCVFCGKKRLGVQFYIAPSPPQSLTKLWSKETDCWNEFMSCRFLSFSLCTCTQSVAPAHLGRGCVCVWERVVECFLMFLSCLLWERVKGGWDYPSNIMYQTAMVLIKKEAWELTHLLLETCMHALTHTWERERG